MPTTQPGWTITIAQAKAAKRAQIKQDYRDAKYAEIEFNGSTYDFPARQANQADLSSMCIGATQIGWFDKDGELGITTIEHLRELAKALNNRGNELFAVKIAKNLAIKKAKTLKAINAIEFGD